MKRSWTENEKDFIRSNLDKTSGEIALALGRSVRAVSIMINRLGITRAGMSPRQGIRSEFSESDILFIKCHIDRLNNRQIADHLGKTLTVVRNKIYDLGLQRNARPAEWSAEQTDFLIQNYRIVGDVELGELMNVAFPDSVRKFGRKTIQKKRKLLGLHRSKSEVEAIISDENHKARCNTILQNSASLHFKDGWVATTLATKKHPDRIKTFLKYPELIEFKRSQLKLNRAIKQQKHDNSSNSSS